MSFPATDRLKRWYQSHEIHFAVARPGGDVGVGIAPRAVFLTSDTLALEVPNAVWSTVRPYLEQNPWIALHPGGLGAVKAPYQAKGTVREWPADRSLQSVFPGAEAAVGLLVDLRELYITKPGPEAGTRVDQWTVEQLTEFERTLGWLQDEHQ